MQQGFLATDASLTQSLALLNRNSAHPQTPRTRHHTPPTAHHSPLTTHHPSSLSSSRVLAAGSTGEACRGVSAFDKSLGVMPDGSLRPPSPPTSTGPLPTPSTSHSSIPMPSRSFPLSARRLNTSATTDDLNAMKAKIFGSAPSSPTTARPKTGHQSVRGRISGPIPIPNPLDDDEFPMRNPGTGIASATPIENDLVLQRPPLPPHPPHAMPPAPSPPVTPSFAPPLMLPPPPAPPPVPVAPPFPVGGRADAAEAPRPYSEMPGTPTRLPSSANGPSGPSPEGSHSSASATRSSPAAAKTPRANPSSNARYSTVSATSDKTNVSNGGQTGPPQRKKSTLRSAIGRLLRRKKKDGSLSSVSEVERPSVLGAQQPQHRSVSLLPCGR